MQCKLRCPLLLPMISISWYVDILHMYMQFVPHPGPALPLFTKNSAFCFFAKNSFCREQSLSCETPLHKKFYPLGSTLSTRSQGILKKKKRSKTLINAIQQEKETCQINARKLWNLLWLRGNHIWIGPSASVHWFNSGYISYSKRSQFFIMV